MPGSPAPLLRLWNTHWQFLKELSTSPSICPCTGPYQPRREAASRFRGLPEPNQIRLPGSDSQQIVLFAHKCSNLIFSSQPWHYSRAVALEPVGKQSLTLGRTEGLWVGSERPALPCWLPPLWVQLQRLFSATFKSVPSSASLLLGIRLQLFLLSGWIAWSKWHW